MKKKTVNSKELYKDFNRALEAYKALNPDKYTSLENICYTDIMEEHLIPFLRELEPEILKTDEELVSEAHKAWIQLISEGTIDRYSRVVINEEDKLQRFGGGNVN